MLCTVFNHICRDKARWRRYQNSDLADWLAEKSQLRIWFFHCYTNKKNPEQVSLKNSTRQRPKIVYIFGNLDLIFTFVWLWKLRKTGLLTWVNVHKPTHSSPTYSVWCFRVTCRAVLLWISLSKPISVRRVNASCVRCRRQSIWEKASVASL